MKEKNTYSLRFNRDLSGCLVIITVESFFTDHNSGLNGWVVLVTNSCHWQVFIEVVHRMNHTSKAWCATTREKQCHIFEKLNNVHFVSIRETIKWKTLTFKRSRNFWIISHLCASISYSQSFMSCMLVILLTAFLYQYVNSSMSYVAFQQVQTSQRIMQGSSDRDSVLQYHWGRAMVLEFLIANASLRIWGVDND